MLPTPLPRAFDLLEGHRSPTVDAALLECLPHFAGTAQEAAVRLLIERGHVPTLTRVIAAFPTYDKALQETVVKHALGLSGGIRSALASDALEDRTAAVDVAGRSQQPHLAYMLGDALRHECPRTRSRSAQGLRSIASAHLETVGEDIAEDQGATVASRSQDLADALQRAVTSWDAHTELDALEAVLWFADRLEPVIRRKLQDPNSTLAPALRRLIQTSADARRAGFVMRALAIPALQGAAVRRISRGGDAPFIQGLIQHSTLLQNDEVFRGWRRINDWQWLYDAGDSLVKLRGAEAVGAVRLIAAAGGPHERKMELFRELLNTGHEDLRHLVLGRLAADKSEPARALLRQVAARSSDPIAQEAGRLARGEPASRPPEPVSSERPADTPSERPVALQDLQVGLVHQEPLVRARALQRLRQMKGVRQLAAEVYRLAHDPDPVVRSLAVSLLGELPGATSERILRAAVNDADERVQANAIEALDRLNLPSRVAVTAPKLTARSGRVRANAVKSLLRTELRQSAETLLDMLEDASRAHRLSALWVVERLGLGSMLERLEQLSAKDPDQQVRQRARRVLRGLMGRQKVSTWWHDIARTGEMEDERGSEG